jgi:hypothetical protein
MAKKKSDEEYVGIAGAIGGTTTGMVALVVIFASSHAWVIAPIVGSMALLGIGLAFFKSRSKK